MLYRTWLVTRNLSEDELIVPREYLEKLYLLSKAVYVVGQLEKAPTTGTLHIHAYVNFKQPVRQVRLKSLDSKAHLTAVVVERGADKYCMKEKSKVDGPWEFGVKPVRRDSATDWQDVFLLAKKRQFDKIPSSILVRHYSNLNLIAKDYAEVVESTHLRGIFIYGRSGIGKSLLARSLFPDLSYYAKSHNKWFDSYKNEDVIVWDDINPDEGRMFATHIKLWTDRYGVMGETKGSGVPLVHQYFIMTSQYSLKEVFSNQEDYDAIERRSYVYHMNVTDTCFTQFSMTDMRSKLFGAVKPDISKFIKP